MILADAGKAKRRSQNYVQDEVGLYEILVMLFGVTNGLAQFMNMMKNLPWECLDAFVVVFLDNVRIYPANPWDHAEISGEH